MSDQHPLTPGDAARREAGVALLTSIAVLHAFDLPHKLAEAPYMAAMFAGLITTCAGLAIVLVRGGERVARLAWAAAAALSASTAAGYLLSRSVALPQLADHVGDWANPLGIASLAAEAATVALAAICMRGPLAARRVRLRARVATVGGVLLAVGAPGVALAHPGSERADEPRATPAAFEQADSKRSGASARSTAAPAAKPSVEATMPSEPEPTLPAPWGALTVLAGGLFTAAAGLALRRRAGYGRAGRPGRRRGAVVVAGLGVMALTAAAASPAAAMPAHAPYPDLGMATAKQRAQARTLWRSTRITAARRFPSYARALAAGYRPDANLPPAPLLFHVRSRTYNRDRRVLDARRPEALVYLRPREGAPVLLAFVYRTRQGHRPSLGGDILAWHRHGGRSRTIMTHVWLTRGLRAAYARCAPVPALEAARLFTWDPDTITGSTETSPCGPDDHEGMPH